MKRDRKTWASFASLIDLSLYILVPVLLCMLIAFLCTRWFGESELRTSIIVILGILAGLRNFWVWCKKQVEKSRESENRKGFGDEITETPDTDREAQGETHSR